MRLGPGFRRSRAHPVPGDAGQTVVVTTPGLALSAARGDHDVPMTVEDTRAVDDSEPSRGRASVVAFAAGNDLSTMQLTCFDRRELDQILRVYGRKVAEGEWRDYAIDQRRDEAVFSVFRRTSETPLYRIVKQPKLARKQGAYALMAGTGQILKRGHELGNVLRALEPRRLRLVEA